MLVVSLSAVNYGFWYPLGYRQYFVFGGGGGACERGGMLVVSLMSVNYGFQYPSGYQQYFVFGGGGGGGTCKRYGMLVVSLMSVNDGFLFLGVSAIFVAVKVSFTQRNEIRRLSPPQTRITSFNLIIDESVLISEQWLRKLLSLWWWLRCWSLLLSFYFTAGDMARKLMFV